MNSGQRSRIGFIGSIVTHIFILLFVSFVGLFNLSHPPANDIVEVSLFGGGGGGGITITPVAFIVIENGKCRMMQINNYTSSADRAIAMIPELVDKVTELLKPESKEEAPASEEAKAE